MFQTKTLRLLIVILLSQACKAKADGFAKPISIKPGPTVTTIYKGTDVIWGFDFLDTDQILFTERTGAIRILSIKSGKTTDIQHVPTSEQHGQGGMMDIALHPDFKTNGLVYMSYTVKVNDAFETRVSRAKLNGTKLENLQVLFTSNSGSKKNEHFGSRIVFDRKGHIFFSVGERGNRDDAQKLTQANGKIHRLNEDGSIPTDNPFVAQKDAIASIWSYGHRNPQGLFYDVSTNILWENEHGPKGGDEINIIQKGKNYGWPVITYGREYYGPAIGTFTKEGMEQPIYYYVPSIATCGLTMYKGNLYSGALVQTHLNRLVMDHQKVVREERLLEDLSERIRNVRTGPDSVYLSTDTGKILQLKI